jgi:hypothetical protein
MARTLDPRKEYHEPDVSGIQAEAEKLLREALDLLTQVELAGLPDDQVMVAESRALQAMSHWVDDQRMRLVGRMATRALRRQ